MSSITLKESVQQRAYELFMERGGTHGSDQKDWFQAEKELSVKVAGSKTGKRSQKSSAKRRI